MPGADRDGGDPFHAHPELRDKLTPAEASFFRHMTLDKLEEMLLARGLATGWWHSDDHREAERARFLDRHGNGDLWVFGYASLMWDPGIHFAEVRRAHVPTHARRFILKDIYGGRGDVERPGLMAALDDGAGCDGLVFRIADADLETETEALWRREQVAPAYHPTMVTARLDTGPVAALAFTADHASRLIDSDISHEDQLECLCTGAGFLGTSADYIRNTAAKLADFDIEDKDLNRLLLEMEARLAATA